MGRFARGQLQHGIGAEGLVVVEVFITEGDGGDPLGDHGHSLVVEDEGRVSGIGNGVVEGVEQPDLVGDLTEQKPPRRRW